MSRSMRAQLYKRDYVTPFVAGFDECSHESSDDHEPVEPNGPDDRRPGYSSCKKKIQEQ